MTCQSENKLRNNKHFIIALFTTLSATGLGQWQMTQIKSRIENYQSVIEQVRGITLNYRSGYMIVYEFGAHVTG